MSLHAGISRRRMLLLWVHCCSLSAFDSLHVCASWAKDVKCLWINRWGLLYSECCFFHTPPPISENTVVWDLLKSCTQLAHEARNVYNSQQQIMQHVKQFYNGFLVESQRCQIKSTCLVATHIFSRVYRNILFIIKTLQWKQNIALIYESKWILVRILSFLCIKMTNSEYIFVCCLSVVKYQVFEVIEATWRNHLLSVL